MPASHRKPFTMTSNEILKADVLDIVFDNRNKKYGAYLLRKYYNNRLMIGLSGMLGFVLVIVLIVGFNPHVKEVIEDAFTLPPDVVISLPPTEPPPPPPVRPPEQNHRQVISSDQIIIADQTDVHTQDEIEHAVVSGQDVEGDDVTGTPPAINESGNAFPTPITETPPPPPPAPTTAASFPGGLEAWTAFLNRHLRTPGELDAGQKKSVLVRFAVGEDGSVTQFEIVQSGGILFDNEVIRVLKKMPRWKPAVQNGRNVSVLFTQPVTFVAFEE